MPRAASGAVATAAGTGEAAPAAGRRILVVDDNVDAAQMVAMLLEALGHKAMVAHDPFQALDCARAEVFDACLDRLMRVLKEKMRLANNNLQDAIRRYNGTGTAAIEYADNVMQMRQWAEETTAVA